MSKRWGGPNIGQPRRRVTPASGNMDLCRLSAGSVMGQRWVRIGLGELSLLSLGLEQLWVRVVLSLLNGSGLVFWVCVQAGLSLALGFGLLFWP